MGLQTRKVIVKQLPQSVNDEQAWAYVESIKASLPSDRPRIVLNCAAVHGFTRSSLHLLLCCLEEAMKHNGDVRLSCLAKSARAVLYSTGIENLFKIFDSDAEAIRSFQRSGTFAVDEMQVQASSFDGAILDEAESMELPLEAAENAA